MATAQADMQRLGALHSLIFVEVSKIGGDAFEVRFANGILLFTVTLRPDGKIALGWYQEEG